MQQSEPLTINHSILPGQEAASRRSSKGRARRLRRRFHQLPRPFRPVALLVPIAPSLLVVAPCCRYRSSRRSRDRHDERGASECSFRRTYPNQGPDRRRDKRQTSAGRNSTTHEPTTRRTQQQQEDSSIGKHWTASDSQAIT